MKKLNSESGQGNAVLIIFLFLLLAVLCSFLAWGTTKAGASPAITAENSATIKAEHLGVSSYGCIRYTRGMVIHGYSLELTHSDCDGEPSAVIPQRKVKQNVSESVEQTSAPEITTISQTPPAENTPQISTTPSPVIEPTKTPDPEPYVPTEKAPTETPSPVHPNSGRGNGSEIDPTTGLDIDPGNSAGHNHGGD